MQRNQSERNSERTGESAPQNDPQQGGFQRLARLAGFAPAQSASAIRPRSVSRFEPNRRDSLPDSPANALSTSGNFSDRGTDAFPEVSDDFLPDALQEDDNASPFSPRSAQSRFAPGAMGRFGGANPSDSVLQIFPPNSAANRTPAARPSNSDPATSLATGSDESTLSEGVRRSPSSQDSTRFESAMNSSRNVSSRNASETGETMHHSGSNADSGRQIVALSSQDPATATRPFPSLQDQNAGSSAERSNRNRNRAGKVAGDEASEAASGSLSPARSDVTSEAQWEPGRERDSLQESLRNSLRDSLLRDQDLRPRRAERISPSSFGGQAPPAQTQMQTIVQVTIGRIEVRTPAPTPEARSHPPIAPKEDRLSAYLERRR